MRQVVFAVAAMLALAAPVAAQSYPSHECNLTCGSPWIQMSVGGGWIEDGLMAMDAGVVGHGPQMDYFVTGMEGWVAWQSPWGRRGCRKSSWGGYSASCNRMSSLSCGPGGNESSWLGDVTVEKPRGYLPGYLYYRATCSDSSEN